MQLLWNINFTEIVSSIILLLNVGSSVINYSAVGILLFIFGYLRLLLDTHQITKVYPAKSVITYRSPLDNQPAIIDADVTKRGRGNFNDFRLLKVWRIGATCLTRVCFHDEPRKVLTRSIYSEKEREREGGVKNSWSFFETKRVRPRCNFEPNSPFNEEEEEEEECSRNVESSNPVNFTMQIFLKQGTNIHFFPPLLFIYAQSR